MWFQALAYFRFLIRSTNEYGVHSPFVFELVTKCFYDKTNYPEYEILKNYRRSLADNQNEINVTDFGAGSKVFKSNRRKISHIAKTAGISKNRAKLLLRLVRYCYPENILEIGTSLGMATSALSLGNRDARIISIEGCPETASIASKHLSDSGLSNVDQKISDFDSALAGIRNSAFELIYFDGNHRKEATLNYFETLLPTIKNNSVWIFDDIHWSPGMESAWEFIKKHPKVTVTIDTFQWGIVFFRSGQEKEHFIIRG